MEIDIDNYPRYRVLTKQQLKDLDIKCGKYFHGHGWRLGGWTDHYAVEEDWLENQISLYKRRRLAEEDPIGYANYLITTLVDKAKL